MSLARKIFLTVLCFVTFLLAIPWAGTRFGFLDFLGVAPYKLGLDLHGGVELDYLVDFTQAREHIDRDQVINDLKVIIDRRVRNLGSSEPTLFTANYSDETHLIVQIPTPSWGEALSPSDREARDRLYIQDAKDVIGKIVKIQFKEPRPDEEYQRELQTRPSIVSEIADRIAATTIGFPVFVNSLTDSYENVFTDQEVQTKGQIASQYGISLPDVFETNTYRTDFFSYILDTRSGQVMLFVEPLDGDVIASDTPLHVTSLFVDDLPLDFRPARGNNGEILDERYLINTLPSTQATGQYVVSLIFNTEGQKMFGDVTGRNIGSSIAIFLGNELLTNPNVSEKIIGNAIITPGFGIDSKTWATELSYEINEGIVPVPIYQHSERTIGPNLGVTSLKQLIQAGMIGFVLIAGFVIWQYGRAGVIASLCLLIYVFSLLAAVRFFGVVLTLAGFAGVILSLGMAIDANILILERVREQIRDHTDINKALRKGFEQSWSAIWDANITGLLVGLVLWWAGVSLIKGFGLMLVLGILISLFVVRSVCMPLTSWWVGRTRHIQ